MRRQWRIGTFSMGILLLFLGFVLLFSTSGNQDLFQIILTWWPVVLVTIGLEVLVYLFLSKEKQPFLKYDFLSILFIGVLGFAGIGFYLLSSFGIVDEVKAAMSEEVETGTLPQIEYALPEAIEKVVIVSDYALPDVLQNDTKKLIVFGSYESSLLQSPQLKDEDIVEIVQAGNTLYVQFLQGDYQTGIAHKQMKFHPKISIPSSVEVEYSDRDSVK